MVKWLCNTLHYYVLNYFDLNQEQCTTYCNQTPNEQNRKEIRKYVRKIAEQSSGN